MRLDFTTQCHLAYRRCKRPVASDHLFQQAFDSQLIKPTAGLVTLAGRKNQGQVRWLCGSGKTRRQCFGEQVWVPTTAEPPSGDRAIIGYQGRRLAGGNDALRLHHIITAERGRCERRRGSLDVEAAIEGAHHACACARETVCTGFSHTTRKVQPSSLHSACSLSGGQTSSVPAGCAPASLCSTPSSTKISS